MPTRRRRRRSKETLNNILAVLIVAITFLFHQELVFNEHPKTIEIITQIKIII